MLKQDGNNRPFRIAFFSSWLPAISDENNKLCEHLVKFIKKFSEDFQIDVEIITGGCSGIPALVVQYAHQDGVKTTGFFPHESEQDHDNFGYLKNSHDKEFYLNKFYVDGFTARSLAMIKYSDIAISLNGRIGTLSEITMSLEEGLPLVVFEKTGGVSGMVKNLIRSLNLKNTDYKIHFL